MTLIFSQTTTTIAHEFVKSVSNKKLEYQLCQIAKEIDVEFSKRQTDFLSTNHDTTYTVTGHWNAINLVYKSLSRIPTDESECRQIKERSKPKIGGRKVEDSGKTGNSVIPIEGFNDITSYQAIKNQCQTGPDLSIKSRSTERESLFRNSMASEENDSVDIASKFTSIKHTEQDINTDMVNCLTEQKTDSDFILTIHDIKTEDEVDLYNSSGKELENDSDFSIDSSSLDSDKNMAMSDDLEDTENVKAKKAKRKMKRHNCKEKKQYSCNLCSYVTETEANLKGHLKRVHLKEFSCKFCGKAFGTRSCVNRHEKTVHLEPQYSCGKCDKNYRNKRNLLTHIKTHEKDYVEPSFDCHLCDKSYKAKFVLNEHIKTHAVDYVKPKFDCEICSKSFTQKCTLTQHVKSEHLGLKKGYMCPTCGKSFRDRSTYITHATKHTGIKPYICDICGKAFSDERALKGHCLIHDPVKHYECEICQKTFRHSSSRAIHMKTHTQSKENICTTCGKGFTQKQALERHERIHSGAKPYLCILCNKTFNDTSIIRRHMIHVHKNVQERWRKGVLDIEKQNKLSQPEIKKEGLMEKSDSNSNSTDIKSLEKWCDQNPPIRLSWNKLEIADKLYQQRNLLEAHNKSLTPSPQVDLNGNDSDTTSFADDRSNSDNT